MALVAALARSSAAGAARSDAAIRSACTPEATVTALRSFAAAFNTGDSRQLDLLFARPPLFRWYSSNVPGLRRSAAARNRSTLTTYFRSRHRKRDRLRLVSFTFTGNYHGYGNFVFDLKRSAADHHRGAWFGLVGKGAATCAAQPFEQPVQFVVLSLGGPGSDRR